ncbi:glycosyltransferase family 4 protein [Halobacterium salinarum]|uniref:glycosyltransferase family 4 protein n=1 Tax=Halobacterium salinarum TaxID=2242 RepID=UPI0025561039|nr:glycosyltransferase family 4 protein [Halobacterium salinarum]MDL0118515.1 glycosyltransferase family 4 protein [Halobacterium salinarum]MDL0118728.1 glycosyltransferase family 4 protein [Halobacterium salinarum]MDL0118760.1 glycosyltransferase family 4 protein [Halobacterium salinarum]
MDLLYVVNQFPKLSESFVINELYELDKRGHNLSVFALSQPDEQITHTEIEEMDITTYYADNSSLSSLPNLFSKYILNPSVLRQAAFVDDPLNYAHYLHIGKQIMEFIGDRGGVDLIHAHFATPNRLAVSYAAAYYDIPCTITAHAHEIFAPSSIKQLRRVCSRFNHIIVPSEYNKRYLSEEIGINTDMTVVPATTSVKKFEPSNNCVPGRLLTIARLVEKKGHEYAIDAVAELNDQGYDVEYHIVGTGERKDFLRERVSERGIEDNVKFLGHVSDEQLESELYEAELFVLPCVIASNGDRDVAPVALKEAMATRTACLSTCISAIPELITDGHDGILVEPNNSEALTDAISSLLDDPIRREEIAANGRKTVETKFDISQAVDLLEATFDSIQSRGRN